MEDKEETKLTWITCPECGAKIGVVLSVGKASAVPEKASIPPESMATWPTTGINERLSSAGVDLSLLDVEEKENVIIVSPKKFLGDLWGPVNDAIKAIGGNWIREGRQSRWEISKQDLE